MNLEREVVAIGGSFHQQNWRWNCLQAKLNRKRNRVVARRLYKSPHHAGPVSSHFFFLLFGGNTPEVQNSAHTRWAIICSPQWKLKSKVVFTAVRNSSFIIYFEPNILEWYKWGSELELVWDYWTDIQSYLKKYMESRNTRFVRPRHFWNPCNFFMAHIPRVNFLKTS